MTSDFGAGGGGTEADAGSLLLSKLDLGTIFVSKVKTGNELSDNITTAARSADWLRMPFITTGALNLKVGSSVSLRAETVFLMASTSLTAAGVWETSGVEMAGVDKLELLSNEIGLLVPSEAVAKLEEVTEV